MHWPISGTRSWKRAALPSPENRARGIGALPPPLIGPISGKPEIGLVDPRRRHSRRPREERVRLEGGGRSEAAVIFRHSSVHGTADPGFHKASTRPTITRPKPHARNNAPTMSSSECPLCKPPK